MRVLCAFNSGLGGVQQRKTNTCISAKNTGEPLRLSLIFSQFHARWCFAAPRGRGNDASQRDWHQRRGLFSCDSFRVTPVSDCPAYWLDSRGAGLTLREFGQVGIFDQEIFTPLKNKSKIARGPIGAAVKQDARALRAINPQHKPKNTISPMADLRGVSAGGRTLASAGPVVGRGAMMSPMHVTITPQRMVGMWNSENASPIPYRGMLM